MLVSDATAVISTLATMPGVVIAGEDATDRFEGMVRLRVVLDAHDSNRQHFPGYLAMVPGGARAAFLVRVDDIDDTGDLVARVVDVLAEAFTHELREFTRLADGTAPVHPHIGAGIDRWVATHPGRRPADDHHFGTA